MNLRCVNFCIDYFAHEKSLIKDSYKVDKDFKLIIFY